MSWWPTKTPVLVIVLGVQWALLVQKLMNLAEMMFHYFIWLVYFWRNSLYFVLYILLKFILLLLFYFLYFFDIIEEGWGRKR